MSTSEAPAAGRNARGQFVAGNPGGPGNPFARQVAAVRTALLNALKDEDIAAIVEALVFRARAGNIAAASLLFAYGIGKPAAAVDPDSLDIGEWNHFKQTTGLMHELPSVCMAPSADLPVQMVRTLRPTVTADMGRKIGAMVGSGEPRAPPPPNGPAPAAPPSPNGAAAAFEAEPPPLPDSVWERLFASLPSTNGKKRRKHQHDRR